MKLVSHMMFLLLFAVFLLCLIQDKVHNVEYALLVWTVTYLMEAVYQVVKKGFPSLFEVIEIIAGVFFIAIWIVKWYADTKTVSSHSVIDAVRVLFSLDFICYMLCTLEFFYIDKFLGPLLRIMLSLLGILMKVLIIITVFVLAYAIASESVLYPEKDLGATMIFNVFRRPFWAIFAEFRLEELNEDCSNIADCSPETRRGSPSHVGSYFIHPLMWIYFIIVNILVFSLLIAMFNSKIRVIEEQATEVWHHQFLQFTMKFYSTLILPPPFTLLLPFLLYCRRTGKDGPFHQEVMPTELSNLQRIEASGRYKFIQDIDDQEISVVCNGVLHCPHKDDNKNKAPETKTDNSKAQTSNRRPSMAEPKDPNVPRPPESVQAEVTATEDGRTLQERIIDALSYTEDVWGTIESHAQFIQHLREMLNPAGQDQANVFAVKNAEGSTLEEIHLNKEATNLSLTVPDMERPVIQQDINIITVDPANGSISNLRENLTTTPNMEFVSLGQPHLATEGTTLSEIDI